MVSTLLPIPRHAPGDVEDLRAAAAGIRPEPVVRRRRRFFADPRFFIGLIVCAASIVGVWWVVASAAQTRAVAVATATLVPGQVLTESDVAVRQVSVGVDTSVYLAVDDLVQGWTATRVVGAGELIPHAAVTATTATATTTVVITSSLDTPSTLQVGDTVEVWQAPALDGGRFDTPVLVVDDAIVGAIAADDAMIQSAGTTVEVIVDRDVVRELLAAVAAGSALSVIPGRG